MRPKVWKHVAHIGSEQLFVFTTTVLVTVTTDLLWGIAAGIAAKLILEVVDRGAGRAGPSGGPRAGRAWSSSAGWARPASCSATPSSRAWTVGDTYHMYFGRPMVCFNSLHLHRELSLIPAAPRRSTMHITDLVTLIDHTTATTLLEFVDNFKRTGRGIATIVGLDKLRARSHAEASMRVSAPIRAQERAEALTALAKVSLTYIEPGGRPDHVSRADQPDARRDRSPATTTIPSESALVQAQAHLSSARSGRLANPSEPGSFTTREFSASRPRPGLDELEPDRPRRQDSERHGKAQPLVGRTPAGSDPGLDLHRGSCPGDRT